MPLTALLLEPVQDLSAPTIVYALVAALVGAGGVIAALARAIHVDGKGATLREKEHAAEIIRLREAHATEVKGERDARAESERRLNGDLLAREVAHAATILSATERAVSTLASLNTNLEQFSRALAEATERDADDRPPTKGGKRGG